MPVTFNNVTINRVGLHGGRDKLLDKFPGAAAAYSLRSLNSFYRGSVVQVRRSGDNAEETFTANQISDGTLAAWVTAGGGTEDGFVKTWYDQSGNGNDASQATAVAQPQIVSSGAVLLLNSRPAISIPPNDFLNLNTPLNLSSGNSCSYFMIYHKNATGNQAVLLQSLTSYQWLDYGTSQVVSGGTAINISPAPFAVNTQYLHCCIKTYSSGSDFYSNGTLLGSSGPLAGSAGIDVIVSDTARTATMLQQEFVYYTSDQSSNRTGIESNIASHYGITLS